MANKSINIKLGNKDVLQKFVNDSFDNKTANNLTTTVEGFSLDARQGKVLDQKIKTVSDKVDIINGTGEGSIQDYVNDAVT